MQKRLVAKKILGLNASILGCKQGGRGLKFDKKPELADVDIFNTIAKAEDQLNLAVLTCLASLSKDHGYNPSIPKVKYNYLEAFKRALEVSVGEVSSPLSCNCQFCRTDIDILIRNISAPLYFSELGLLVFPNTKSLLNEAIRYYLAT